jgi:hypothetical protein
MAKKSFLKHKSGKSSKRSKKISNRRSGPIKKRASRVSKVIRKSKYTASRNSKRSSKSGKLRLKSSAGRNSKSSSRKGKLASERSKRAARGCSRQFTKKYSQRNSPPYPANNCCGSVKRGNDRKIYKSIQRTKASPCIWKRVAIN